MGSGKTKKIKVMLTITDLSIGGIELVNLNLASHLDKSRFEVTLVCWRGGGPLLTRVKEGDFKLVIFNLPSWNFIWNIYRYYKEMKRLQIDVLHGNPGTYARVAAYIAGVPVIISSLHNMYPNLNKIILNMNRLLGKITDRFVAVSDAVGRYTSKIEWIGSKKLEKIYNGINMESFTNLPEKAKTRKELGFTYNVSLVATVGRLTDQKGVDIFIRSCMEISRQYKRVRFIIVGEGPCRKDLENLVEDLGMEEEIEFWGARHDIPKILSALDIMVVPSRWAGFELTLAEAMAAGVPVVASKVGPIPEVIADGETGILVPAEDPKALADAVIQLLGDSSLRKRMGEAGKKRVLEKFTVQKMVSQYEALYERLVAEKMGGRKGDGFHLAE